MATPFPPINLKAVFQNDGSAENSFVAMVNKMTAQGEQQFKRSFGEISQTISKSLSGFKGGQFGFKFDIPGLKQAAVDAEFTKQRLIAVRDAAINLARSTSDTSRETQSYITALRAQVIEADRAAQSANAQVTTYTRLQTELDKTVSKNQRLAESYRQVEIARGSGNTSTGPRGPDARFGVDRLIAGQASLDRAAVSATTLEQVLGRVSRGYNQVAVAADGAAVAAKRGTDANHLVANSAKSMRFASIQAGQQIQDLAISLYSGQRASVVFAQQIPQLAFVLTGLEGSANKTQAAIGRFASFLSKPSGFLVIGAASLALGYFVEKLFSAGDEAEKTKKKTLDLAEALGVAKFATDEGRKAIDEYNDAQQQQRNNAEVLIKLNLAQAESDLKAAAATRERLAAELARQRALADDPAFVSNLGAAGLTAAQGLSGIDARIAANAADIARLTGVASNLRIKDAQRDAEAAADPIKKINDYYEDMANVAIAAAKGNQFLEQSLKGVLTQIEKQKKAALDAQRESEKAGRKGPRDPGELTSFISPVTGGRITGQFGEERSGRRHGGVDIAVPVGTPVKAPAGGVVVEAGTLPGYGNVVFIDHGGGTITRLAHLSRIGVAEGQSVAQGEIIGASGGARGAEGAGNSRGPHLHQETRVNGRAVNPLTGRFPTDGIDVADRAQEALEKSAAAAAKAKEQLEAFGERSAESIARINERFNEQPRLIDQAAQATRALDDTIKDLSERKPPGFENLIADAQAAKGAIRDALVRPFEELERDSQRRIGINRLLASGREDEAQAVQEIWRLEDQLGPLTDARKESVFAIARAERAASEELERQQEIVGAYLDATRSIRDEIEGILSGDKPNFKRIFKQLQGKILFEQLGFGDIFRQLDKDIRKNSGIDESVDKLVKGNKTAGESALDLARDFADAGRVIRAAASGDLSASSVNSMFDKVFGSAANDNAARGINAGIGRFSAAASRFAGRGGVAGGGLAGGLQPDGTIVVTGKRDTLLDLTPASYFDQVGRKLTSPLLEKLDSALGTRFFAGLSGVLGAAFSGYAVAGVPGAVLGAVQSVFAGSTSGIGKTLGSLPIPEIQAALALNSAVNGLLGNDQIKHGGTFGLFSPILTALFGKALKGSASISGAGGSFSTKITGNSKSRKKASGEGADTVIDTIESIAEQLGGILDTSAGNVSIGVRKKSYKVDPTGQGRTKGSGVLSFGKDAEAAVRAATLDLLKDGVISGLRAGSQRLLENAKTIEQGLSKALSFQSVFDRLKARADPVGAALDVLDREFSRLKSVFAEAGASAAEYADLEKLYGQERADAIKQAVENIAGSLKSLYSELTVNNQTLSLRDRKAFALAEYNPLAARVGAGDVTAFNDFSDAARALLAIEREMSGSGTSFFVLQDQVTALTKGALDATTALADAAAGRDSPFSTSPTNDNQGVVDAIATSNDYLSALVQNVGILIQQGQLNQGTALAYNAVSYF